MRMTVQPSARRAASCCSSWRRSRKDVWCRSLSICTTTRRPAVDRVDPGHPRLASQVDLVLHRRLTVLLEQASERPLESALRGHVVAAAFLDEHPHPRHSPPTTTPELLERVDQSDQPSGAAGPTHRRVPGRAGRVAPRRRGRTPSSRARSPGSRRVRPRDDQAGAESCGPSPVTGRGRRSIPGERAPRLDPAESPAAPRATPPPAGRQRQSPRCRQRRPEPPGATFEVNPRQRRPSTTADPIGLTGRGARPATELRPGVPPGCV